MKISLYSVSYSGIWYKGNPLTIEELMDKAVELGFDGIEIDSKRPHGFPLDLDKDSRKKIIKMAESRELEICAIAGNNNFVSPIDEQRENELLMLSEQLRLASDIGAPLVRVFLAWRGVTRIDGIANYEIPIKYDIDHLSPDATYSQRWKWAREALTEGVKLAEKYNIVMALQNHGPLIQNYNDMLNTVNEIGSEYLKCCLDCPLLISQDDEYIRKAVTEVGNLQVLTHFGGEWGEKNGKVERRAYKENSIYNYPMFVRALKEIGYDGHLSYELCHPVIDDNREISGIDRVHEQVRLARTYMSELLKSIQ